MSVSSEEILDRPARLGRRRPRGTTARFRAGYDARLAHAAGITLYESFEAAEPVWREFETHAAGTAFQSFDWLSAWYRHVGRELGVTPAIAVVTRQGAPLMLAPLGIERRFGLSLLVWMGGRLADYKGPLLAPDFEARLDVEFATLWRQIRRALPRHDLVRGSSGIVRGRCGGIPARGSGSSGNRGSRRCRCRFGNLWAF